MKERLGGDPSLVLYWLGSGYLTPTVNGQMKASDSPAKPHDALRCTSYTQQHKNEKHDRQKETI